MARNPHPNISVIQLLVRWFVATGLATQLLTATIVQAECGFGLASANPGRVAPVGSYVVDLDITEDYSNGYRRLVATVTIVNRSGQPLHAPAMWPPCGELQFDIRSADGKRINPIVAGAVSESVETVASHELVAPHSKRSWRYVFCTFSRGQPLDPPLCAVDFVDVPDGTYSVQAQMRSDHVIVCPNRKTRTACQPTSSPRVTFKIENKELKAIWASRSLSN